MVAIGEGRTGSEGTIVPCHFKTGDSVKFLEYAPVEIKVGSAIDVCGFFMCEHLVLPGSSSVLGWIFRL